MTIQLVHHEGSSQCISSVHIATLSGIIFFFRALSTEEEIVRSPQEAWGFSEVGACPLAQHRRLPRPILASMDGSGSGCLGRGGLARGIQDPILSGTSLIRATSPHALLSPVFHQGKSLGEGVSRSSPQPLVQPSSKRFHVMESAGLVDESSQQSPNLAWFGHMRNACDLAQRKFESKVSEGKSLSSMLTSVSRTERVSDSPCQGRAVKVNSQVFDLMSSRPAESRSVPLSVREATTLETALCGVMESYNFQLWTVTALFRFLGDSGCCPMDDPLLDQFQRSFSRGAENVAAALASTAAFVTAKRRESFLSHMFPSVTDAQKRKLLSDPVFDQKDLFAPASIEAAREAARDFSLYRGAQSRPSTSSGSSQRRQFNSSTTGGRHNASPRSTSQRSPASSSSSGRFRQKKKSSDPPRKRGGFRR